MAAGVLSALRSGSWRVVDGQRVQVRAAAQSPPAGERADGAGMTAPATFAALHFGPRPLLLANAWDVASAVLLEAAGAPSVGTTSLGVTAADVATGSGPVGTRP